MALYNGSAQHRQKSCSEVKVETGSWWGKMTILPNAEASRGRVSKTWNVARKQWPGCDDEVAIWIGEGNWVYTEVVL